MADTTKRYFTDASLETLVENVKSYSDQAATSAASSAVANKADKATTLAGYGIGDAYTKTQVDGKLQEVNTSITNITNGDVTVAEAEHTIEADHATTADSATTATTAGSATKATQDGNGKVIADTYETKSDATAKLAESKTYTDQKTANLITTSAVDTKISTHNTSTTAHSDIRDLISALSTKVSNFLDVDDTTTDQLSEVLAMIEANEGTIESLTSGKVNVSDIVDNLTTNNASKVLSAKQGLALKGLIDALQTAVDGKAASGHKHAIADVTDLQTTLNAKATQSSLDTHTGNTTVHITATERTNWNAAKTHADSAHAPSNAEKNQNAFSNVAVSGQTTVAADTATDTLTLVAGDNVTITTNATNDSVTISAKDTVVTVDSSLSSTSTNPVQNKVVTAAINSNTEAIGLNTNSIASHTTAITNIQTELNSYEEITSAEITALFNA